MERGALSSRDSGVVRRTRRHATAQSGTLTQKIPRQLKTWVRPPAMAGASACPAPATAIQMLKAVTSSLPPNSMGMMASVAGRIAATPIRARPAMSIAGVCASAATTEATANSTRPRSSTLRRPKMSPKRPAAITRAPVTSVKIVFAHCSVVIDPPMSSAIAGVATGRLAAANHTMAAARQRPVSDHQRLGLASRAAPSSSAGVTSSGPARR